MPETLTGPLTTILAYLLGSIPFGYLIVRWQRGIDVRATGSGSIGATNVMRNLGVAGFLATFLLDAGKGAAAVLFARRFAPNDPAWVAAAAVAAILGHCLPLWLRFRGGKGVATGVGAFVALSPLGLGAAIAAFVVIVGIWRYISLGSILATAAFPVAAYFIDHAPAATVFGAAAAAGIIIAKHHANIARLLAGRESRLGRKISPASPGTDSVSPQEPHESR